MEIKFYDIGRLSHPSRYGFEKRYTKTFPVRDAQAERALMIMRDADHHAVQVQAQRFIDEIHRTGVYYDVIYTLEYHEKHIVMTFYRN